MLAKKLLGSRSGGAAAYSGDIAVAHNNSPFISVYPWSAGFGTKYADPVTAGATFVGRPSSDITTTNWTRSSGTNAYYTYVDEVTADNNDYLETTVTGAGLEVKLSEVTDPLSSSGHIVRVRTWVNGGGGQAEARTILLLQGATTIATVATGSPGRTVGGQVDYTLTSAEANSITDYSDLRIRVTANTLGNGESIRFGWAELATTDPQPVAGNGRDVAFSPDGATIAVAHFNSPFISVYPWSSGFGTKYANPATLPANTGLGVAFSPDGATIAVAHFNSPFISVYPWSSGFGTKYANPATLPAGTGNGVAFSPDGATIAVAHSTSPFISVYPWSSGFGTKYANPVTLPASDGFGVAFSPDDATIAVVHLTSPYISVYPWSAGFGTKYANPVTLPASDGFGVAFSPDGATIAVVHTTTPFISVYPWSAGFGTKYADPATLPAGTGRSVAFSPDGATIAVAHATTPFISVYPWSAGFGTKYANPATLPASDGNSVAFSP